MAKACDFAKECIPYSRYTQRLNHAHSKETLHLPKSVKHGLACYGSAPCCVHDARTEGNIAVG